jgi:predicted SprT family Zn-dependent metalloprotease
VYSVLFDLRFKSASGVAYFSVNKIVSKAVMGICIIYEYNDIKHKKVLRQEICHLTFFKGLQASMACDVGG